MEISRLLYLSLLQRRQLSKQSIPMILKEFRNAVLVLVGGHTAQDEEYVTELRRLIESLDLGKKIYFTGMLTDVRDALKSLDVVVLPSLDERCSRSLLEAIACGKAAVATRVGGTPEIIKDSFNGILVDPKNESQIARALIKLLADSKLREAMGKRGRELAKQEFDIVRNMEHMRKLYLGLKR